MTNRTKQNSEKLGSAVISGSMTSSILSSLENVANTPATKRPEQKKASGKTGNKLEDYVNFLRALASPERLSILEALETRTMCTSDIEQQFFMEQSTASHHLTTLLKANIVKSHKEGRRVFYKVNEDYLSEHYKRFMRTLTTVPKFKGKVEYKTK